ncbi:MAG TPA: hypothetical protein VM865_00860 [Acidobacteriaceae bacterium]|nr:hypothetical protein [Acidobacteriaceae bacterium]
MSAAKGVMPFAAPQGAGVREEMMGYLLPAEYVAFGLTAETPTAWITTASAMMEAYCKRPTLLSASYTERVRVARHTQRVRLSYGPLTSVDGVRVRYAQSSGCELGDGFGAEVAAAFGVPGSWATLDPATLDVDLSLGEFRFGWNLMGLRYAEAEVTYTAGLATVPDAVKVACAQVVKNAQTTPGLNVRSSKMDTLQTEYFSDSLLDSQVRALLRPYVAERLA